jgi:hypothetical protein
VRKFFTVISLTTKLARGPPLPLAAFRGRLQAGSVGDNYLDLELSLSFAKTSSMLKLAAFCRCG